MCRGIIYVVVLSYHGTYDSTDLPQRLKLTDSMIYHIIHRISNKTLVAVPLLLLAVAAMGQAGTIKAWDEGCNYGCGYHHWSYFHHWNGGCSPLEDMSTNWRVIHTTLQNMTKQDNAALQKQNSINGTWNFVNETRGREMDVK